VTISYLASEQAARRVVLRIEAMDVRGSAVRADQARQEDVRGLVSHVMRNFGHLDIVVNNAAVFVTGNVDDPDSDTEAFQHQCDVNARGVIQTIRAAARVMRQGGRIITLSSVAVERVGYSGLADFASSKASILGYSKGAARDLGPAGITVNVVQVASIDTPSNPANGPFAPTEVALNALGRYGTPEEVAAGIVFLASPAASFITGSVLTIDGGYGA
jgi:NAD(P)-dependent dehydrogenase (short-subunit alcohol dehydrogenase family)